MRRSPRVLLLSILAIAVPPASAGAADDLVLRQRIAAADASKQAREQMQYFAGLLRITDDERMRTIADLDKRTLTVINKKDQTYSVTTFDEIAKRQGSHDKRIKNMPPQVRDMVHADDPVALKKTGKKETIAGYSADEYLIEAKSVSGRVWITEEINFGPTAEKWRQVAVLFGGTNSPGGHLDDALAKIKGVPLRREINMEPLPLVTTEVIEVRQDAPPAELRRIPEGYRKVALPEPRPPHATPRS